MAFKGGYKLIDLKETDFTAGTAAAVEGVYDAVENNYGKPTIVCGLVIGGVEKSDAYVNFAVSGTSYVGQLYADTTITIASDDKVTITVTTS